MVLRVPPDPYVGASRFLDMRIGRRLRVGKRFVSAFVSNNALASIRRKVKALTGRSTRNLELSELLEASRSVYADDETSVPRH